MSGAAQAVPRISCLLPVYNGERFLDEAVRSILDQTMSDFELVVVDDGSTDGTASILAGFAASDPRVKVLTQRNGGIVAALNAGLALCRGDYVARMDADDVAMPDRFAFQADYLDTHPRCVLVGGYARWLDADGTKGAGRTSGGRYRTTDLAVFPPRIAVSMHPLVTIRRAALTAIGGYRGDFPHAEDYDLFIRLAFYGTIDNPDRDVLYYRRHEGAISLRHVDEQERSAAYAEIDARDGQGMPPLPDWLIESYVRMRIWRRCQAIDPARAVRMAPAAFGDLLNLRPRALASVDHWNVRLRLAAIAAKLARRRLADLASRRV